MNKQTKYLPIVFWAYVLVLAFLNLKPGNPVAPEMGEILFIRRDYFEHILAFTALSGLYGLGVIFSRPVFRRRTVLWGTLLLTGLAIFLETLQCFVPFRRFNWYDMLANMTGLVLGALLAFIVSRFVFRVLRSGFRGPR
jgi:VanZ family protein